MPTKPVPKKVNPAPVVSPNIEDSNRFNIGGNVLQTMQLMSALKGAPTPATTPPGTLPGAIPTDAMTGTAYTGGPSVSTTPAVNMPAATLTPPPAQTIMGMQPEQFGAVAGLLGSALAPNEYGPTGQLVPSRMGQLGNLAGMWGIAQMLAKQGSAPRTAVPKTGGE